MWIYNTLPMLRASLCAGFTMVFLAAVYLGLHFIQEKQVLYVLQAGGIAAVCYGFVQGLCAIIFWQDGDSLAMDSFGVRMLMHCPVVIALALLSGFAVWEIVLAIYQKKWEQFHVCITSIKESVDQIPFGLCFYYDGGLIKLCNSAMEGICLELMGTSLQDGEKFWKYLHSKPIVRLSDGSCHSFQRIRHVLDGQVLYEILSTDVTQEYGQELRLKEKEQELKRQGKRLKELGKTIVEATEQQEILNAKVRLHSDFGNALLLAKRYLLAPDGQTKRQLIEVWTRCSSLIRKGGQTEQADAYHAVFLAAKDVGVKLVLNGELPRGAETEKIVAMAIGECLTNAFRHAKGDTLYISTVWNGRLCSVSIQNNGKPPEKEIEETGGLSYLRRMAESRGVEMSLQSFPEFRLELFFGDEYGL